MHTIEPYFNWRNLYAAEEDERSPFYGREYSELYFTDAIYDHYIHPQWDNFGSNTLFVKILFADYDDGFAIMELMGEWNDTLYNDIRIFKRDLVDALLDEGIRKFVLIGENVLNFHPSDDSYYEEWYEDLDDGWIALINFRHHVVQDFRSTGLMRYFTCGEPLDSILWETYRPLQLFQKIEETILRMQSPGLMLAEFEEEE